MLLLFIFVLTPFSSDRVEIVTEGGDRIVHLIGSVIIEGEDTKITCQAAKLNEKKEMVVLQGDVRIFDKNGEVHAASASYYFNSKKGYLNKNVTLFTTDLVISSDSLYYDGINDSIEMFSNVILEDKKNSLTVYGRRGWYSLRSDEGHLIGNPSLVIHREEKEPINVKAKKFRLITEKEEFFGFDSVVAIIDSITVYCDTFSYNLRNENGMMVRPIIVEKNNELRGASGEFKMEEKSIEHFSVGSAWARYYSKEGSKNIVEGQKIDIVFKDGKASRIYVNGKPRGVLTLKKGSENAGN